MVLRESALTKALHVYDFFLLLTQFFFFLLLGHTAAGYTAILQECTFCQLL